MDGGCELDASVKTTEKRLGAVVLFFIGAMFTENSIHVTERYMAAGVRRRFDFWSNKFRYAATRLSVGD